MLVLPDATSNRLIVMAPDDEFDVLEGLSSRWTKSACRPPVLEFSNFRQTTRRRLRPFYPGRSPASAQFPDPKSNSLIVSGEPEDLQAASVIVEQLDNLTDKPNRAVQVFTLVNSPADVAATQAKEVYMDQMKGKTELGDADAMIMADASGNRLIVTANIREVAIAQGGDHHAGRRNGQRRPGTGESVLLKTVPPPVTSVIANVLATELERSDAALKLTVTASADDRSLVVSAKRRTWPRWPNWYQR